jgi:putative colanic acid biosynthesis acetyltransferase WcaF
MTAAMPDSPDPALLLSLVGVPRAGRSARDAAWDLLGRPLFRLTFHNWYGLRRALLRCFGASVHLTARIRPTVRIDRPANFSIGEESAIGDHAILTCIAPITIGDRCTISQYAHLCSGSHDCTSRPRPVVARPIRVHDNAWVGADAFIFPGVTIGDGCIVGARSTVRRSLPAAMICGGDDAKPLAPRIPSPPRPPAAPSLP